MLNTAQTSTKRRNILKATIIVAVLVVSSFGALFYLLTYDNVTVSGSAGVSGAAFVAPFIKTLEFHDTQTGAMITFHFASVPQGAVNFGNYSVTLKNGHTYNVYISFSVMNPQGEVEKEFIRTFTVNATAGQKEITEDFQYPNPPT